MRTVLDEAGKGEAESLKRRMQGFMRSMGPQCAEDEIPLTAAMMCSVRLLSAVIERTGNRLLEEHGLTLPQWLALGCIAHGAGEGVTHSQIGQRLMLSKAPITGIVDRLERAGFAERRADAHDRRVSRVVATESGTATWWKVRETMRQHAQGTVNETLSADEQQELLRLIGRLLDAYSAQDPTTPDFGALK